MPGRPDDVWTPLVPTLCDLAALLVAATARLATGAALAACLVVPLRVTANVSPDDREIALAALLVGGVLLTYVVPLVAPAREMPGLRLDRDRHPALWHLVDQTALATGAPNPDAVRISAEGRGGVSTRRRLRRPHRLHRTLWIGLPVLPGLDVEQLRAVVAHEVTHLARHAGWLDRQVQRDDLFLRRVVSRCSPVPLLGQLVAAWGLLWALLATPRLRRQELEADAVAADTVGRDSVAAAVLRGHDVAHAWQGHVRSVIWPAVRGGSAPAGVLDAVRGDLADGRWLDLARTARGSDRPSRLSAHPTVQERLAALGVPEPDGESAPTGPAAVSLLGEPDVLDQEAAGLLLASPALRSRLREEHRSRRGPRRAVPTLRLPRPVWAGTVTTLHVASLLALVAAGGAALTVPLDLGGRSTVDEVRLVVGLGLICLLARAATTRLSPYPAGARP